MTTCDGWEELSHEAGEAELALVGSHTRLCRQCYARFEADPLKKDLLRYL